ncbi:MAG TPA: hypothetical protein VKV17_14270 [Bryobacteraceae bacterium]|nr:hypothetical protein [Bryobacteraceae bacterium]
MRLLLLVTLASQVLAAPLEIVQPQLSNSDGGAVNPADFVYHPGETIFFSCRVRNYQKTPDEKIHLTWSIQTLDAEGVPLVEPVKNEIVEEVGPQDKDWMPRLAVEIPLPPLIGSATYQVVVSVNDLTAKTQTELKVPFAVRSQAVRPSDSLTLENLHFFRSENDTQPLEKAAYRPGDAVWMRFDITGFRYGPKNKIDVSYAVSVLDASGKVLWTQPEPATAKSESFYPKLWIPASMSVTTQKNTSPGEYGIAIEVKDAIGNQMYEAKANFTIE